MYPLITSIKTKMQTRVSELFMNPLLWRIVGFVSSVVGFTCFALSPSFYDLFGEPNQFKIVMYSLMSCVVTMLMMFVPRSEGLSKKVLLRAHVSFLVLMLTSLYSFWEDRAKQQGNEDKGLHLHVHRRMLNLCSSGAFGVMSLSLSRQLELEFEVGIFNFFLGCFLVTLMKMNFKLAPVAALLCYVLVNIRYFSDFLKEMHGRRRSGDRMLPHKEDQEWPRWENYLYLTSVVRTRLNPLNRPEERENQ